MRMASPERIPECSVVRRIGQLTVAEQTVVLANNLITAILNHVQKQIVHLDNQTIGSELDGRNRVPNSPMYGLALGSPVFAVSHILLFLSGHEHRHFSH